MKIRKRVTAVFFLFVLGAFFVLIVVSSGYNYLSDHLLHKQATPAAFDTLAAYPFAGEAQNEEHVNNVNEKTISEWWVTLKAFITNRTTASSPYLNRLVLGKSFVDRMMGLDMTASLTSGINDLKNPDDIVAVWQGESLGLVTDDFDPSEATEQLVAFGKQMCAEGRNFLLLLAPSKQAQTPAFPNYFAQKQEEILQELRENEFDVIDMEAEIEKLQVDKASLFFKTDHHWLPTSGIWADQLVCEFMNEHYGYSINTDLFAPENYETTVLHNAFLGSLGRKVSTVYCNPEDFPIVMPKYDTDLDVFISRKNETNRGDMRQTLFDESILNVKDNVKLYAFYGYGEQALIQVHNHDVHDGSRVLVVKTSFANCMIPYFSAAVEYLDVVDLRVFKGSLQTLIGETDPDTILVVYGITYFGDASDQFDFS